MNVQQSTIPLIRLLGSIVICLNDILNNFGGRAQHNSGMERQLHYLCLRLNIGIVDVGGFGGSGLAVHPGVCLVEMFFKLGESESPHALLEVYKELHWILIIVTLFLFFTIISLSVIELFGLLDQVVLDVAAHNVECLVDIDPCG